MTHSEELLGGPALKLGKLADVHWATPASGISVSANAATELEEMWIGRGESVVLCGYQVGNRNLRIER